MAQLIRSNSVLGVVIDSYTCFQLLLYMKLQTLFPPTLNNCMTFEQWKSTQSFSNIIMTTAIY